MKNKLESKLEESLNCAYLKIKDTAKTLTIVANYITIEEAFDSPITIVDLFAKYNKTTNKLTLNYEVPLIDYKADITRTRHVKRTKVDKKMIYGKTHKTNGEPRYIEVKGEIRGYENDMTRTVNNPDFEEWDEPKIHEWVETVEKVYYKTKINKTFVQDFNEKNKLINDILKEKIMLEIENSL